MNEKKLGRKPEAIGDCLDKFLTSKKTSSPESSARKPGFDKWATRHGWQEAPCAQCGIVTEHRPDGRCLPCFKRVRRLHDLFENAGIPARHEKILTWGSLKCGNPAHTHAVKAVRQFLANDTGSILALIGPRGTGKTQIGVVAVADVIRTNLRSARRMHLLDLLDDLKRGICGEGSEADWLERWCRPALLVIDEITQRVANAWTGLNLTRLLDKRYEDLAQTIIVGNVELAELTNVVGASTVDRMNEGGGVIVCDWPSFRQPEVTQ